MEKFWAAILIFVVVAAAGLMYVNQVYNPQKDSQVAMADTANQTLSAVRSDVEDTAPTTVTAATVINTANTYCKAGNTIDIIVITSETHTYKENCDGISAVVTGEYYTKKVDKTGGEIKSIKFTKIS